MARNVYRIAIALLASVAAAQAANQAPLADAARLGDLATVRRLLVEKANPNQKLADGSSALHWVARANDVATAELLLQAGADPNARSLYGVTPLELAAVNGSAAMIAVLTGAGADANSANPNQQSVLMFAARTGNPQAMAALLDRGARINAQDSMGQTALMWATVENHPEAAKLLIARGADVNLTTKVIESPHETVGNLQGINRAQNRAKPVPEGGMTALLFAARDGAAEIAKMLVSADANINQSEAYGSTPLLLAINNGWIELAEFLLDKGADAKASDGFGRTPLWSAVDVRNLDFAEATGENGIEDRGPALQLIRKLLEKGADPNAVTTAEPPSRRWMMPFGARRWVVPVGETPFVRAATASDIEVMKLLLEFGANPNLATKPGVTALMAAAGIGWVPRQTYSEPEASTLEAVKLCIAQGGDVNAVNAQGYAAIHGAAFRGLDRVVEFLAANGADVNLKDRQGKTAAEIADGSAYLGGTPSERRPSTIALLERLGATKPDSKPAVSQPQ